MIQFNLGPFSILDYKGMREATMAALQKTGVKIPNLATPSATCPAASGNAWRSRAPRPSLQAHHHGRAHRGTRACRRPRRSRTSSARSRSAASPLILISHNLRQVFDLVDRIVVFRRGRICADLRKRGDRRPRRGRLHHRRQEPGQVQGRRVTFAGADRPDRPWPRRRQGQPQEDEGLDDSSFRPARRRAHRQGACPRHHRQSRRAAGGGRRRHGRRRRGDRRGSTARRSAPSRRSRRPPTSTRW